MKANLASVKSKDKIMTNNIADKKVDYIKDINLDLKLEMFSFIAKCSGVSNIFNV